MEIPNPFEITEEDFFNNYKPVTNHIDNNASCDGRLFETYGAELEYIQKVAQEIPNRIWTYMDGDDGSTVFCAGYHHVNRIGYFITEVPWTNPDMFVSLEEVVGK